jgi:hypothetical protein
MLGHKDFSRYLPVSFAFGNFSFSGGIVKQISYTLKKYVDINTDSITIKKAITIDGYGEFMLVDFKLYCTVPLIMIAELLFVIKETYETF